MLTVDVVGVAGDLLPRLAEKAPVNEFGCCEDVEVRMPFASFSDAIVWCKGISGMKGYFDDSVTAGDGLPP